MVVGGLGEAPGGLEGPEAPGMEELVMSASDTVLAVPGWGPGSPPGHFLPDSVCFCHPTALNVGPEVGAFSFFVFLCASQLTVG